MARSGGIEDSKQATPLYQSGRTNGPVGGPRQPPATPDPFKYLDSPGSTAPSGSPGDKPGSAVDAPASHHGR